MHDGDIIQLQYGKSSGPALLTHPSKSTGMLKQIVSQGILLALIILLGSLVAACSSQPEPYPTYTREADQRNLGRVRTTDADHALALRRIADVVTDVSIAAEKSVPGPC